MIAFYPLRVSDSDDTVHTFVFSACECGQDDKAITLCGKACGTWPCVIGADATCTECIEKENKSRG